MATLETVVERATCFAAGMCVAALGGIGVPQSLGAVSGVVLHSVFLKATKKWRVECDQQLERLAREVKARLTTANPAFDMRSANGCLEQMGKSTTRQKRERAISGHFPLDSRLLQPAQTSPRLLETAHACCHARRNR